MKKKIMIVVSIYFGSNDYGCNILLHSQNIRKGCKSIKC